jgi:hypothetical protein
MLGTVAVPVEDERLSRLSELCLGLPEAERELAGRHAGFRVRRRTFAWYLDDHHGDGVVAVTFKAVPEAAGALLAAAPERFFRPAYTGSRGWLGLRLDRGPVDWDEVAALVADSYRMVAPRRLAALADVSPPVRDGPDIEGS